MRLIDADKLYPDRLTKTGELAISQSQIADAPTAFDDKAYTQGYKQGTCDSKYDRPQGEWLRHIRSIECSVCKNKFFADDENENCQDYEPCIDFNFNYCPKCGADMRGGRE